MDGSPIISALRGKNSFDWRAKKRTAATDEVGNARK